MADKVDGKECRYWFRPTPGDYRKCALRGKDDNCDEIEDCFIKELLGKLAQKEQELDETDVSKCKFYRDDVSFVDGTTLTDVCSIWIWQRDYSGLEPNCIMGCHCSDNPNCSYKQLAYKDKKYEKVKQTFNMIKEIADNREIFCENCGCGVESFTCEDCGYVKILQKISEVEKCLKK